MVSQIKVGNEESSSLTCSFLPLRMPTWAICHQNNLRNMTVSSTRMTGISTTGPPRILLPKPRPRKDNLLKNKTQDIPTETWKRTGAKSGEWQQTHGAFKAAYRPVPTRWADSEILTLLREHVRDKSAVGFQSAKAKKTAGGGLGRMPNVKTFDS